MEKLSLITRTGFQLVKDVGLVKKFDRVLQFSYEDFCKFELFNNGLLGVLNDNNKYSILCRIGYLNDSSQKLKSRRSRNKDFNKNTKFTTD